MSVYPDDLLSLLPGRFRKGVSRGCCFSRVQPRAPELQWERGTGSLETDLFLPNELFCFLVRCHAHLPAVDLLVGKQCLTPGLTLYLDSASDDLNCLKSLGSWAVSKAVLPGLREGTVVLIGIQRGFAQIRWGQMNLRFLSWLFSQ